MSKPVLGVVVGGVLGLIDGASAWAYPEARAMIAAIVVASTVKGILTGLLAGLVVRRVASVGVGVAVGTAAGLLLSVAAAGASPEGQDHYWAIVLPGMLVGTITGYVTARYPRAGGAAAGAGIASIVVLSFVPQLVAAQRPAQEDALERLGSFEGRWTGTTSGQPGEGTVSREYARVLRGRFLRITNRSEYPPREENRDGEVHEDVGYFSFDRQRRVYVLRQFHVEGFVNVYVAEAPATATAPWVFTSEGIENIAPGWRARETYTFHAADELEEVFELAAPGKEFELYSRSRLKRAR